MNATARHIALFLIASTLMMAGALSMSGAREQAVKETDSATLLDDDDDLLGIALGAGASHRPTVQAAFRLESYRRGDVARLVFSSTAPPATLQVFRAGTEKKRVRGNDAMTG